MLAECIALAAYFATLVETIQVAHGSEVKGAELNLRRFSPWTGKGKSFCWKVIGR